jgi:hypothetical protein
MCDVEIVHFAYGDEAIRCFFVELRKKLLPLPSTIPYASLDEK